MTLPAVTVRPDDAPAVTPRSGTMTLRARHPDVGLFDGVGAARVDVAALGDSITEGFTATVLSDRWIDVLAGLLRTEFSVTGGDGYVPATRTVGHGGALFPQPVHAGTVTDSSAGGPGYRCVIIGTGGTVTYEDYDGDLIEVWYVTGAGGFDPLLVSVDGGATVKILTDSGVASYQDERVVIDLGGPGPHDIVFSRHAGGGSIGPILSGVRFFDGDGPTDRYVALDGSGDWVQTPDSAGLSITGDLDLRARVRADDYTPAAGQTILSKWNTASSADQRSYRLDLHTNGELRLFWSTDGTAAAVLGRDSSGASFSPDTDYWVRATMDVDDGAGNRVIRFYYSTDDTNDHTAVSWTEIGSAATVAGTTSVFDSTAAAAVGCLFSDSTPQYFDGRVYAAAVLDGIGGTVVADPRFDRCTRILPDSSDNIWTLNGNAALVESGTQGIQVLDWGRSGATMASFTDGATGASAVKSDLNDWLRLAPADVLIVAPFINEWQASTAVATAKANATTVIEALQEGDTSTRLLLVAWYEPDAAYAGSVDWGDYVAAIHELADELPRVLGVVDFTASDAPVVATADGLHPSTAGHATIAARLFTALTSLASDGVVSVDTSDPDRPRISFAAPSGSVSVGRPIAGSYVLAPGASGDYLSSPLGDDDCTVGYGGDGMDGSITRYWASGTVAAPSTATSTVTLIVCVAPTDWTPATEKYLCGWGLSPSGPRCYLILRTAGTIRADFRDSGNVVRSATSSTATGFTDGHAKWLAAVIDKTTQTVSFYTSGNDPSDHPGPDPTAGGDWSLLGTADVAVASWDGTFLAGVTTAYLSISSATLSISGKLYAAEGHIDGTPAWEVDFSNETHGATSITDERSVAWTATGTGISVVRAVGALTVRMRVSLDDWTPATATTLIGHRQDATRSWRTYITTGGAIALAASTDGTTEPIDQAGDALSYTNGTAHWVEVARTINGVISYRKSDTDTYDHTAVSWSAAGSNDTDDVGPLKRQTTGWEIGSIDGGTLQLLDGRVYAWAVLDALGNEITSARIDDPTHWTWGVATSGTDEQANVWTLNGNTIVQ